jgi:hypothetical protein
MVSVLFLAAVMLAGNRVDLDRERLDSPGVPSDHDSAAIRAKMACQPTGLRIE